MKFFLNDKLLSASCFDYSNIGIIITDECEKIEYCNKIGKEFLELESNKLIGKNIKTIFPNFEPYNKLRDMPQKEFEIELSDKKTIVHFSPIMLDNGLTGIIAFLSRNNLEIHCDCNTKISKELDIIMESIYDEIYVTDSNLITLYVNSACKRFTGLEPNELIGKNIKHIEEIGVFYPVLTPKVIKEKRTLSTIQMTKSGRQVIVTASPVFDDNGNVIKVVSVTKDLNEINFIKKDIKRKENSVNNYKDNILNKKNTSISGAIIYESKKMKDVISLARKVAKYDSNIIILGESGVGKGLLAKYIHSVGKRNNKPFITVNCGAIPENLIESELFGYEKGAFTGANKEGKTGMIQLAHGGTLFLDEISELPLQLQVKLLSVIQEKTITKVGGYKQIKVDFRLITATNKSLVKLVENGLFRNDLFFRLNVISMELPPLNQRKEDIIPLVYHFLKYFCAYHNKKVSISTDALNCLVNYSWPGNVRELQNVIECLVVTVDDYEIKPQHLFSNLTGKKIPEETPIAEIENDNEFEPLKDSIEKLEKDIILKTYEKYKSTYKIAEVLNISQSTAVRKLKKYI